MTNFQINQGPLQRGLKPKSFFSERKRMIELSAFQSDGGLKLSKDFNLKNSGKKLLKKFKPEEKSFFEILPWTLFLCVVLYGIIL